MRKPLSEYRTLALSFIFLFSKDSSVVSKFTSLEKVALWKNLHEDEYSEKLEDKTILTCYKIAQALQKPGISEDEAQDKLLEIRGNLDSQEVKNMMRIVSSLLGMLLHPSSKHSESNLIIESLRPFLKHLILTQCEDIKFEWWVRMIADNNDSKIMIPDLAIFVDPISTTTFELFVMEVKKHGNLSNGNMEKDLVKLGKEMKLALDKLIQHKVKNPKLACLWEVNLYTLFSLTLLYKSKVTVKKNV